MADRAVLFADVAGSTSLYEILGDQKAFTLIEQCLDTMSKVTVDRKSTRLNSSHSQQSRMPSSA